VSVKDLEDSIGHDTVLEVLPFLSDQTDGTSVSRRHFDADGNDLLPPVGRERQV